MKFNYAKLDAVVLERYGTYSAFARAMGWSRQITSYKLTGQRPWKQEDIVKAVDILNLDKTKVWDYFFTH